HQRTKESTNYALRMFYRAIELDPNYVSAHGAAAWYFAVRKSYNWMTDREQEIAEAARLARRAVDLTGNVERYIGPAMEHRPRLVDAVRGYAGALSASGFALSFAVGELDNGVALLDRALALNPNLASTWHFSGWARIWLGEQDLAIEHLARAMRHSPFDPLIEWMQAAAA